MKDSIFMKLTGIIPPIVTPFNLRGELDLAALKNFIKQLSHVDGFLILGSNAETPYLEESERNLVVEAARSVIAADKPMMVGTGGESTQATIRRTQLAEKQGASDVLVLAPYYNRASMTPQILDKHFRKVADSVAIPVYIYNIPQVTGITHSSTWLANISTHPNIKGMKDSSGDIMALTETLRMVPEHFNVLTGNAPTLLPALSVGAKGAILAAANVIPELLKRIMTHVEKGQLGKARDLQRKINPLAYAVTRDFGISGLKAAARLCGYSAGFPRSPLEDVNHETIVTLKNLLEKLDIKIPVGI
jgi:4-hydroxy-2-oxoglutarate aldolase